MATPLLAAALAAASTVAAPAPPRLALIGRASVPGDAIDRSGLAGEVIDGVPHARLGSFGSGVDTLDASPGGARVISVCDRGPADGAAPFHCRMQRWTLRVDPAATPAVQAALDATVLLRRPDGTPFTGIASELGTWTDAEGRAVGKRLDPEGIRRLPNGHFLVSEEYMPGLLEFAEDGGYVRTWPVPEAFRCAHPGAGEAAELPPANTRGRQPNKGFEGLAIAPGGEVWLLPQAPLLQDGALNAQRKRAGRNIRMLCAGRAPGDPSTRQVVYRLESPAYGVSELMAIDDRRFVVIERDGSDARFRRLYQVDVTGATDVSGIDALASDELPEGVVAARKDLVLDLADPATGLGSTPEKIEGLCVGPTLPDGRRTLIVVTDNDMKADQPSWWWVFAWQDR